MFLTTNRRPQDGMTNLRRLNNILDEAFNTWPFQAQEGGSLTSAWLPLRCVRGQGRCQDCR